MATVTKGRTFTSGETVTPAKLNDVVDLATVTNIQTADIADGQVTVPKLEATLDLSSKTVTLPDGAVTNDKLSLAANAGEIKKALNADNSPPIFACRAWVNFDGTRNATDTGASTNGANVLIRSSGNVASVLKNAAGDYTVNFTTTMPTSSPCVVITSRISTTAAQTGCFLQTVSASNTRFISNATTGVRYDENILCVSVFA